MPPAIFMPTTKIFTLRSSVPQSFWFRLWAGLATLLLACGMAGAQPSGQAQVQSASAINGLRNNPAPEVFDLSRAWRFMLLYDHTYQAAISERAATQTEFNQGRAGLFPQIQLSYSRSKLSGNRSQLNSLGQWVSSELDYDSSNGYVQLRQPLLNYGVYANYRHGSALAQQGNALFYVRHEEAGLRLAHAYFNVLLAHDDLALQESLTASLEDMAKTLEARYRKSEGTRTDVQETQARLALARAEVIDAQNQLVLTTRELQALLSVPPRHIAALRPDFRLVPLSLELDDWLARARVNNTRVRAAEEAVNVADAEVKQAESRYLPTMDLVASYGKADSENLSSLSQRSNTFIIGIQVNIPIFTGGYTTANTARARLDRTRLQHELNAALEQAEAEVTRQYTSVQGGAERIRALEEAVKSSQLTLDSALKGFKLGAWSNVDVLQAQDNLYQAKYELAKARLEYLQARLGLAAAAGNLQGNVFDEINDIYLGPVITLSDAKR